MELLSNSDKTLNKGFHPHPALRAQKKLCTCCRVFFECVQLRRTAGLNEQSERRRRDREAEQSEELVIRLPSGAPFLYEKESTHTNLSKDNTR